MSELEEIKSFFRSSNHGLYLSICKTHFRKFIKSLEKFNELRSKKSKLEYDSNNYLENEHELYKQQEVIHNSGVIVIVFAAMCLEAFINEYGAVRLSDNYFNRYLDRMNFIAKWVNIPRMVTGKTLSRDSQGFELLQKLNSNRNELVHFKSSEVDPSKISPEGITENKKEFHEDVKDAFKAILEITSELKKIDPKFTTLVVFNLRFEDSDLRKYS